jgi:hypothetical protein
MEHTIENYLIALTNVTGRGPGIELESGDQTILTSIARQVARGVALTDRQYELVKTKLVNYKDQFEKHNMIHLDLGKEGLSQPLRSIDRSQTVSIEDGWLVVRFPFNKKTISQLDTVAGCYRQFYSHQKSSNEHKFKLYEPVINDIVELLKGKKFQIDPQLIEISNEIESIKTRESEFVPQITEQGLKNVTETAQKFIEQDLDNFDETSAIKYWDRSIRYGYKKTARVFRNHSQLAEHLANRTTSKEYINPSAYSLENIVAALRELDRFPLLVTLGRKSEYQELQNLVDAFNFIDVEQQIVLDRVEDQNDNNYALNNFIKEKNFNRWLDKDIKIAYIFKSSLPKLLLKSEWRPIAHLSLTGEREQSNTSSYIDEHCDLSIYHDAQPSYWNNSMSRQLTQWV